MITFIRKLFASKLGVSLTLAFLALIAFAFASGDVSSIGGSGVSGGDQVAVVGDQKISANDLSRAATSAVDSARRENPVMSMAAFLEQDGLKTILGQLTERFAISGFAEKYGLRAGTNLVNSEILNIPAFRGASGNFDDTTYQQLLRQQGLTEDLFRKDLGAGLLAKQVLIPASFGTAVPDKFASQYASLLKESRKGSISVIPSSVFAPKADPTDAQLKAFYEKSKGEYIRPERRVMRYITFDDSALGKPVDPTEIEIAARYAENKGLFAPSEQRTVTQLIVPTQQAAAAIQKRVEQGGSLEIAAREAGLQTAKVGPLSQVEFASQTSDAVAKAVFTAQSGKIAVPARSGLGYHVARIDSIDRKPGRTLDQARADLVQALREEKRRSALSDLAASVEEKVDGGVALSDLAAELKLTVETTKPITGAGLVYGTEKETVPQILGPTLQTAFQMEEGQPQLAEVVPGKTFVVFEATAITPSAPAPLADIKASVVGAWKLAEGSKKAKEAAERILKRVNGGATVAAAMKAEKVALPGSDPINLSREQLAASGGNVPAPLALMFSMAEGTAKKLEAPKNAGWYVVRLDDITPGTVTKDDTIFAQTKRELGITAGREYAEQLRAGISKEIGVEKNDSAIQALRKQLSGEN